MRIRAGALLLSAAALAGCGGATSTTRGAAPTSPRPVMRLTVTYRPHGAYPRPGQANPSSRWTLTCRPPGGTHPARAAACAELERHAGDLAAPRVRCLVIVAGAPSAAVTGTIDGRRIAFATSTCAPAWRTLHALLTGR